MYIRHNEMNFIFLFDINGSHNVALKKKILINEKKSMQYRNEYAWIKNESMVSQF